MLLGQHRRNFNLRVAKRLLKMTCVNVQIPTVNNCGKAVGLYKLTLCFDSWSHSVHCSQSQGQRVHVVKIHTHEDQEGAPGNSKRGARSPCAAPSGQQAAREAPFRGREERVRLPPAGGPWRATTRDALAGGRGPVRGLCLASWRLPAGSERRVSLLGTPAWDTLRPRSAALGGTRRGHARDSRRGSLRGQSGTSGAVRAGPDGPQPPLEAPFPQRSISCLRANFFF